jgi:hypothetical protein
MAKRKQTFERAARKRKAAQRAKAAVRSSDDFIVESETTPGDTDTTKAAKESPKKKVAKRKAEAESED